MATDHIRYDLLAQDALRGLVRKVLADTAKSGLPGEHHFSISFKTDAEGVRMSPRLREQFPQEMTVILQYQFWDLKVTDTAFEVGLSFGGVPEKLTIPFAAIKSFFDPSVQFGLQFETIEAEPAASGDVVVAKTAGEAKSALPADADPAAASATEGKPADTGGDKPSGEVVRLDRFRKK
ncbi:SspB family protein [Pseudorhodoplanes sp.]|uniref:SspB family protein n=1 Tax=Pseudorhodoplanes sp. TaxID=1934341 RepID=UPI002BDCD179|nr:ClpXP protease specificity-enhancing factor SspB [Pseudorhodoplanes sp.]HWV52706.1 ClpXP protease specificity-enhancing factor SspB [Pseudorhodoplanes sp.]